MALIVADRVQETSTTTGTGDFTLGGAVTGFQTFSSVLATADTTYYTIADQGGANWEVGLGTFTSPSTLARATILSSSNAGSAVNFTAGTKNVFITYPANRSVLSNSSGVVPVAAGGTAASTLTLNNVLLGNGTSAVQFVAPGTGGNVLTSNGTTWSSTAASPTNGYRRNRIINGAMQVDQRNGGAAQTVTTAGAYNLDRWAISPVGASVTAQRVAGSSGYQYALQITGAAGVTSFVLVQRIESANIADLVNQNVTLTATISNSLLTTVTWTAYYANAVDNFGSVTSIATGTFTVTSTATQYTATFNLGANAANGVAIHFSVGAQTSGTHTVTGVQLEAGSIATPFERLPIGETLMLCQRYYEIGDWISSGQVTYYNVMVFFKITKRASATVTNSRSLATFTGTTGLTFFYQNAIDASPQNATFTASAEL